MHVHPRGPANPKLAASRRRKCQKAQLLEPRDFSVHTLANGERRGCKIARIFAGSKGSSTCESEHADQITRRNDPPYVHLTDSVQQLNRQLQRLLGLAPPGEEDRIAGWTVREIRSP